VEKPEFLVEEQDACTLRKRDKVIKDEQELILQELSIACLDPNLDLQNIARLLKRLYSLGAQAEGVRDCILNRISFEAAQEDSQESFIINFWKPIINCRTVFLWLRITEEQIEIECARGRKVRTQAERACASQGHRVREYLFRTFFPSNNIDATFRTT
jgi:hypothetical protein